MLVVAPSPNARWPSRPAAAHDLVFDAISTQGFEFAHDLARRAALICFRRQISFHDERVVLAGTVGRLLEDDEQRDHDERRDHQQLEIVDIGDDLRLPRDHGIERGATCVGKWIPELCDGRAFEHPVHSCDVRNDVGVIGLRVLC